MDDDPDLLPIKEKKEPMIDDGILLQVTELANKYALDELEVRFK